jgi:hypothetical protein
MRRGQTNDSRSEREHIMTTKSHEIILHDLLELVAALDRRVPRLDSVGERDIVRDAEGLRRAALKRIAELERSIPAAAVSSQSVETDA